MVIGTNQRCDGFADCPDGSDELDCRGSCARDQRSTHRTWAFSDCQTTLHCPANAQGSTKVCLRGDNFCDGVQHCPGQLDELMYCGRTTA